MIEFFYWPGDQWNTPEFAHNRTGNADSFKVIGLHNYYRQSPRTRSYLEDPANGWIRLVSVDPNLVSDIAQAVDEAVQEEQPWNN